MNVALCSGMPRSGSTWSYNVCRLLYERIAKEKQLSSQAISSYDSPVGRRRQPQECLQFEHFLLNYYSPEYSNYLVYKSHSLSCYGLYFLASQRIKNICTFRDPRDSLASLMLFSQEKFLLKQYLANLIKFLCHIDLYKRYPNSLLIRYEDMLKQPKHSIKKIIDFLDNTFISTTIIDDIHQQTCYTAVKEITTRLTKPSAKNCFTHNQHIVDKSTQFAHNHLSGGTIGRWQKDFTPEEKEIINEQLQPWLIKLGYET